MSKIVEWQVNFQPTPDTFIMGRTCTCSAIGLQNALLCYDNFAGNLKEKKFRQNNITCFFDKFKKFSVLCCQHAY